MRRLATLLWQHAKDTAKAIRYGYTRPALWETRRWLGGSQRG